MVGRLGRYVVLQHLASGGMADVLLARSEGLAGFTRYVVLKRIKPVHARDPRFLRMFLSEARVAAGLHHQHIVQVHDVGEDAGEYFIAMEYLHGEDVRTILGAVARRHRHVPLGHALAIVSATASGLHYAHERRGPGARPLDIVHRDISPSNLLVGYDGSIKIVDFGIAKASSEQDTRSGVLKGKVGYMSPEQCTGAAIDRRSDVYSLGVVLYELCTTTRLFPDDNDYLVMKQIVAGRIAPPRARRPALPGELAAIILRAIAPDRAQRFATADAFRLAIDEFAVRSGLAATTSSIAGFMRAQFGERPEPWLELAGRTAPAQGPRGAAEARPRAPVGPRPAGGAPPVLVARAPRGPARDDRPNPGVAISPSGARPLAAQAIAMPRCVTSRSESKLAWESERIAQTRRIAVPARIALVAVPLLAAAIVASGRLAAPRDAAAAVTVTVAPSAGAMTAELGRAEPLLAGSAVHPARGAPVASESTQVARRAEAPSSPAAAAAVAATSASAGAAASGSTQVARRAEAPSPPAAATAVAMASAGRAASGRPTPVSPGGPGPATTADGLARDRGTQAGAPRRRIQPAGAAASSRPPASRRLGIARGDEAAAAPAPLRAQSVRPPGSRSLPAVSSLAPSFAGLLPAVVSRGTSASSLAPADLHAAAAAPGAPSPPSAGPGVLSRGAIERVAAPARRALSACAGGEILQGKVEVRFSVDGEGKVRRAQLSTALQRPKVAACVLRLVQRWQFPPQRQAGAEGAYTLSFR